MREPVYNEGRDRRIISAPNGLWFPQKLKGSERKGTRGFDPWENIHAAVEKDRAAMSAFGPKGLAAKGVQHE